jgi:hypothetical protein
MDEKAAGELYWLQCDFEWRDDNDWLYDYYNTPEKYVHLFSGELTEWEHLRPRFRLEDGWTFPEKVSFAHNDHVDTISEPFSSSTCARTRACPCSPRCCFCS